MARKSFLEASELGNEKATIELANLYCSGKLGYRDYNKAIEYYSRFQNNPLALYMLSQIYYCEKHTLISNKLNKKKAVEYHKRYHNLIHAYKAGI